MFAQQLIGKRAVRTKPVQYATGSKDYSFSTNPVLILAATESHIIFQYQEPELKIFGDKKRILDSRWCDDNWTDYDELMKLADDDSVKLIQTVYKTVNEVASADSKES